MKGTANSIIIEKDGKKSTSVNLIIYEQYPEEDVAKFMNAYIKSLQELGNDDVRVNLYYLVASNLDIVNDDSLLKGEGSPATLLYVYDNDKLYSQYDETKIVTDINDENDVEVENPTGETIPLESLGSDIPVENEGSTQK